MTVMPPAPAAAPVVRIAIRPAGPKGVGLFATLPIAAGETITHDFAIVLDEAACDAVAPTVIDRYYFAHPGDETAGLLVLGPSALCNHDDAPNAATVTAHDGATGWYVSLVARRPIAAGEEVTRRYACPLWFDPSRDPSTEP